MFIRFESYQRDDESCGNSGVFIPAIDLWYNRPELRHKWKLHEIRRVLDWFNVHLKRPHELYYREGKRAERSGVCWFRASAVEHVTQARYLAWLLGDLGLPICTLTSRKPGAILWQDQHQIVAMNDWRRIGC